VGLNFSFFSKFSFLIHCYGQENTKTQNQRKNSKFHTTIHQVAGPLLHNTNPMCHFYWGEQISSQKRRSTGALTLDVLSSDQ